MANNRKESKYNTEARELVFLIKHAGYRMGELHARNAPKGMIDRIRQDVEDYKARLVEIYAGGR